MEGSPIVVNFIAHEDELLLDNLIKKYDMRKLTKDFTEIQNWLIYWLNNQQLTWLLLHLFNIIIVTKQNISNFYIMLWGTWFLNNLELTN